jgi:hypothetical protein
MEIGNQVRTLAGSIDERRWQGHTGRIQGFARLSSYHPREAFVTGETDGVPWGGYFWVCDLAVEEPANA